MGWYLRKSFKLGPFRINLSKSGLGGSVGVRGARVGLDAKGRLMRQGDEAIFTSATTVDPPNRWDRHPPSDPPTTSILPRLAFMIILAGIAPFLIFLIVALAQTKGHVAV